MYASEYRRTTSARYPTTFLAFAIVFLLLAPTLLLALPPPPVGGESAGASTFAPPGSLIPEAPHRPPSATTPEPRPTGEKPWTEAPPASSEGLRAPLDPSDPVRSLAAETRNATAATRWVGEHVWFTPSWGLRKSPTAVLATGEGNAFDQAQLLADVLRLQGTAAAVAVGTVRVPRADLLAWTGVEVEATALRALAENGVPAKVDGDAVVMEHAWVEALVDGTWLALDPSFKPKRSVPAVDLAAARDATGYQHYVRNLTASERPYYHAFAQTPTLVGLFLWGRANHPEWTVDELIGFPSATFRAPTYAVQAVHAQGAAFPAGAVATVTIEGPGFAAAFPTWMLADRRVTLVSEPSTAADAAIVQGRLGGKPGWQRLSVAPVLKIDGEAVAVGRDLVEGETLRVNVTFDEGRGVDVVDMSLRSGGFYAFSFSTGRLTGADLGNRASEASYVASVFWQEKSSVAREALLERFFDVAARAGFHELVQLEIASWMARVNVVPSPSAIVVGLDYALDATSVDDAAAGEKVQFIVVRDVLGAYSRFGDREAERAFRLAWAGALESGVLRLFPMGALLTPAVVFLASHSDALRPAPPPSSNVVVSSGRGSRRVSVPPDYTDPRVRAFQGAGWRVLESAPFTERNVKAVFVFSADNESFGSFTVHSVPGSVWHPQVIAFGLAGLLGLPERPVPGPNGPGGGGDCKKSKKPPKEPEDIKPFGRDFWKDTMKDVAGTVADSAIEFGGEKLGDKLPDTGWDDAVEQAARGEGMDGMTEAAAREAGQKAYNEAAGGAKGKALGGDGSPPSGQGSRDFEAASGVLDNFAGKVGGAIAIPYSISKSIVKETVRVWDRVNERLAGLLDNMDSPRCDKDKPDGPGKDHPDDSLIVADPNVFYGSLLSGYAREAEVRQAPQFHLLVAARDQMLKYVEPRSEGYRAATREETAALQALMDANVRVSDLPRVLLLQSGFWVQTRAVLGNDGLAVRVIAPNDAFETLVDRHPVLVIPSGGLSGLEAPVFAARLESYARAGGRIVAFSQPYGRDFAALPGDLGAFGWNEDVSCRFGGSRAPSSHPSLAGMNLGDPGVNIDGFFTRLPAGAQVLLERTATGQPAAALWTVGNGSILASTLFPDYAAGVGLAADQDLAFIRSSMLWALGETTNETAAGFATPLDITFRNRGDAVATVANVTALGLHGIALDLGGHAVNVAPNATHSLRFSWNPPPAVPGIWTFDVLLRDATGRAFVRHVDAGQLASHLGSPDAAAARAFDVAVTGDQHPLYGSRMVAQVHLWEREGLDRTITLRTDAPRHAPQWGIDYFPAQTVELPANGHVVVNVTLDPVLRDDRIWAKASDGGTYAHSANLGILVSKATVGYMQVDPAEVGRRPGETVPIWANLTAPASSIVNLTVVVRAPGGAEQRFDVSTRADERGRVSQRFEYAWGDNPSSATYVVRANATTPKRSLAIAFAEFRGPTPELLVEVARPGEIPIGGDPAQFLFTVRNVGLAAATGVLNVSGSVTLGLPPLSRTLTVPPGGSAEVAYPVQLDELPTWGLSLSWSFSQARLRDEGYIDVGSNLTVTGTLDKPRYSPGESANLTVVVRNQGPFRFTHDLTVYSELFDDGEAQRAGLESVPGGSTAQTFRLDVPDEEVAGAYSLSLSMDPGVGGGATLFTLPFTFVDTTSPSLAPGGTVRLGIESLLPEPITVDARAVILGLDGGEIQNTTRPLLLPPFGRANLTVGVPSATAPGLHPLLVTLLRGGTPVLRYADVLNVTGPNATLAIANPVVATSPSAPAALDVSLGGAVPAGSILEVKVFGAATVPRPGEGEKIDVILVDSGGFGTLTYTAARILGDLVEAGYDANVTTGRVAQDAISGGDSFWGRQALGRLQIGRESAGGPDVDVSTYENPTGAWAPIVTRLVATHPWRAGAERVIVVAASEVTTEMPAFSAPPPLPAQDRALAEAAREAAAAANVRVLGIPSAFFFGNDPVAEALDIVSPDPLTTQSGLAQAIDPAISTTRPRVPVVVAERQAPAASGPLALPLVGRTGPFHVEVTLRTPVGDLLAQENASLSVSDGGPRVQVLRTFERFFGLVLPQTAINVTDPALAGQRHRVTVLADGDVSRDWIGMFGPTGSLQEEIYVTGHQRIVVLVDGKLAGAYAVPLRRTSGLDALTDVVDVYPDFLEGPSPITPTFSGWSEDIPTMTPVRLLEPVRSEFMVLISESSEVSPGPAIALPGGRQELVWSLLGVRTEAYAEIVEPNPITVAVTGRATTAQTEVKVFLNNTAGRTIAGTVAVTVPGVGTESRAVSVPAAGRVVAYTLPRVALAGAYPVHASFESPNVPRAVGLGSISARSQLVVVDFDDDRVLEPGENTTLSLVVRNDGQFPAYATFAGSVGSLLQDSTSRLLEPGGSAPLTLDLAIPADAPRGNYTGTLTENGVPRDLRVRVLGPAATGNATLDRIEYSAGDNATVHLRVRNTGDLAANLTVRANYLGASDEERRRVVPGETAHVNLTVPISTPGRRLAWSVRAEAGGNLLVDNIPVPLPMGEFGIRAERDRVAAGSAVAVRIRTPVPLAVDFTDPWSQTITVETQPSGQYAEATTLVRVPAGTLSGDYDLVAETAGARTTATLDVDGRSVFIRRASLDADRLEVVLAALQAGEGKLRLGGADDRSWDVTFPVGDTTFAFPATSHAGEAYKVSLWIRDGANLTYVESRTGISAAEGSVVEDVPGAAETITDTEQRTFSASVFSPSPGRARLFVDGREIALANVTSGLQTVSFRAGPFAAGGHDAQIAVGDAVVDLPFVVLASPSTFLVNGTAIRQVDGRIVFEVEVLGPPPLGPFVEVDGKRHPLKAAATRGAATVLRSDPLDVPAGARYRFGAEGTVLGDLGEHTLSAQSVDTTPGDGASGLGSLPWTWVAGGALAVAALAAAAWVAVRRW